ncbi:MAG: HlyD family secretion protein, partial [Cyanobacteria bacterium P01_H01_bin.130]
MKKVWIAAIFAVGIASGAIATYALRTLTSPSDGLAQAQAEETAEPAKSEVIAALGRLEPRDKVLNLAPPSTATQAAAQARVETIQVKEGDWVTPNQVIALLDAHDDRLAELAEARTRVKNAQARLQRVKAGAQRGAINAQAATVAQLKAQLQGDLLTQDVQVSRLEAEFENAAIEYRRFEELFEEGATSASDRDARKTAMIAAQRRLQEAKQVRARLATTGRDRVRAAEANLDRIQEVRPEDVAVVQTEVESAIAAQQRAEIALRDSSIRAPVAGKVLQIHTRPGEVVTQDGIITLGKNGSDIDCTWPCRLNC